MLDDAYSRKSLEESHYVRKASSHNYWFDFSKSVFQDYRERTSGSFCLVVTRNDAVSDAYVLPYATFGSIFEESEPDNRGRWIGTILNDTIKIHSSGKAMYVADYYNRFDLLNDPEEDEERELLEAPAEEPTSREALIEWLNAFNNRYETATPKKKRSLSERVARPGKVALALRRLRSNVCQICEHPGFRTRTGGTYAETHHIEELHRLIPGSLCTENMIVLCPTCHRKLHFAEIEYRLVDSTAFEVSINNEPWIQVARNIPCNLAVDIGR